MSVEAIAFADAGCTDVGVAGGKGASLARLAALGLPVPPGFVIPAAALDAGAELHELLGGAADDDDFAALAERAQALVTALEIPAPLRESIAARYAALGDDAEVAVRSSACAEDSEAASFAGQQETYLHVRGTDEVLRRVRDCWASFFSERALFYRAQKGSLEDLGMAVVVQRMVPADIAGVLFTIDPTRGRRDRMVVEAVIGLGEAVVSGEVTPDHYSLARDGRVKRVKVSVQPHAVVRDPAGGVRHEPLPRERGAERKLTDEQLVELAAVGRDLHDRLGTPQDIEWAIADGELYVLQARPVTA